MTLLLTVPSERLVPLGWVTEIVFERMLGLRVEIGDGGEADQVVLEGEGAALVMSSLFPKHADGAIELGAAHLPNLPLPLLHVDRAGLVEAVVDGPLPVLFGLPAVTVSESRIDCRVDILGSIFFMLSRYEELVVTDRDKHDRFPATASLAHRAGFLYRPIVDEYVELLWTMMSRLWPGMKRKRRQGTVVVSCDVDQPIDRVGANSVALARSLGGDLLKRKAPALALKRLRNFTAHRQGDLRFDPYYTFDWYMDVCERHGRQAAFYFIADHSAGALDGTYSVREPHILALIRKLSGRGHEVGMHGSYNTFRDCAQVTSERSLMRDACRAAGVDDSVRGNRQHYLRWDAAETPDHLESAGFEYDTSGSYADRPGFRYGTSHPFSMWSWRRHAPLCMYQRPLVLMECSVLATAYLGLGYTDEALELMHDLRRKALKYGGDFTALWHNSYLLNQQDRLFFEEILR